MAKKTNEKNSRNGYVSFNGKNLSLTPWDSLSDLCSKYESQLIEKVNNKANEHANKFDELMERLMEDIQKRNSQINLYEQTSKGIGKGWMNFKNNNDNTYDLKVKLPPFVIEINKKIGHRFFYFPSLIQGITINSLGNNKISFQSLNPTIRNMPYSHPFIYSDDATVCYDGYAFEVLGNINSNSVYDISKPEVRLSLAKGLSDIFIKSTQILEDGYFGEERRYGGSLHPVKYIDTCGRKEFNSKEEAGRYLQSQGSSIRRVIKNDT